jgi:pilus assembly protein CpaC
MRRLKLSVTFISVFFVTSFAFSQFLSQEEELVLYTGETKVISVNDPSRIAIGKPEVIDIIKVTEKEMTIAAKSKGASTLVWWDKLGQHSLYVKVYLEDMSKIKERIDRLMKVIGVTGIETKALDSENKVILQGEVKDIVEKERLLSALGELKDKVLDFINVREEEASVEIEVQVLELDKDASRELGIAWPTSATLTEPTRFEKTLQTGIDALFRISDWTRTTFTSTLHFLVQEGKARILSRPRLVCRSGKEAELLVGGEVPIFTTTVTTGGGGEGTEVEYKEYGIKLKMRPTVIEEGKIDLVLNIEVSEVSEAETIGSAAAPTAKAYPLTKRTISTELSLKDGQTLSIGGLIKKKTVEDLKKFPWLADIPVLGTFFRQKTTTEGGGAGEKGDTELFITLTPHIIYMNKEEKVTTSKKLSTEEVSSSLLYKKKREVPQKLEEYIQSVKSKILKNISYPALLLGTGWEAEVVVGLKISREGELKEAKITKSSGYKIFDEQTLRLVKELSYPPFPPQIDLKEITVEVPIVYSSKR